MLCQTGRNIFFTINFCAIFEVRTFACYRSTKGNAKWIWTLILPARIRHVQVIFLEWWHIIGYRKFCAPSETDIFWYVIVFVDSLCDRLQQTISQKPNFITLLSTRLFVNESKTTWLTTVFEIWCVVSTCVAYLQKFLTCLVFEICCVSSVTDFT